MIVPLCEIVFSFSFMFFEDFSFPTSSFLDKYFFVVRINNLRKIDIRLYILLSLPKLRVWGLQDFSCDKI